jgi:hypothetical protein
VKIRVTRVFTVVPEEQLGSDLGAGPATADQMQHRDPEVQASSRLEATVPLGDAGSLQRLRERTEDTVTRTAGSTALVDADIPPGRPAGPGQEPGGPSAS